MPFAPYQIRELALVVALAAGTAASLVAGGRFDLVSGNRAGTVYDKTYRQADPVTSEERREGGWVATEDGLVLASDQVGRLALRLRNDHEGRLVAFLYGRAAEGSHLTVSASGDGERFRAMASEVSLDGGRVDLTPAVGEAVTAWLRIEASPSEKAAVRPLVLSRVRVIVMKPPTVLPNWPIASLLILAPAAAYRLRARSGAPGAAVYALAILCGLAVLTEVVAAERTPSGPDRWWEAVLASQDRDLYFLSPYAVLLALLAWRGRGSDDTDRWWPWFALAGIVVWGASRRLAELAGFAWSRLDPDVIAYVELAEKMRTPYGTGSREPLWIWMIKLWFWLAGDSSLHLRVLTVALSLLVLVAAYKLFKDLTGSPVAGLLTASLLSVNPYLVTLSVRGLREEAYMLAVLGVVYFALVPGSRLPLRSEVAGLTVSGVAAHLLRLNSYTFVLPLLAYWAWRQEAWARKALAVPVVAILLAVTPHLVHNQREFGDPLYSMNVHFVWMRNVEFVAIKKVGCAGCPSREELEINSTSGPSIGALEYLFGMHSVGEVLTETLRGYLNLYLRPTDLFRIQTGTESRLAFICYLFGLVMLLAGPHRMILAVLVLIANAVPFALALGIDPRLAVQTVPFATFILAYGLWRGIGMLGQALGTIPATGRIPWGQEPACQQVGVQEVRR